MSTLLGANPDERREKYVKYSETGHVGQGILLMNYYKCQEFSAGA